MSLTTDLSTAGSGGPSHRLPDPVQPECAHIPPFQQPPPSLSPGHPESPNLANRAPEAQGRPADTTPPQHGARVAAGKGLESHCWGWEAWSCLAGRPGSRAFSCGFSGPCALGLFAHLLWGWFLTLTPGAKSQSEHLVIAPVHPVCLHWPCWAGAEAGGAGLEWGSLRARGSPSLTGEETPCQAQRPRPPTSAAAPTQPWRPKFPLSEGRFGFGDAFAEASMHREPW